MFVSQLTFSTLELKSQGTKYVIGWKLKVLFDSKLLLLHGAFVCNIKYFGCKIGIQFNNSLLVEEQNNCTTKTVNAYIVYDLDNRPKIPLSNFTLKNCLFCATNIGKNNVKSKYMNSSYGIVFDGLDSWSFGNDFARNVVIFGADNISSSHTDNRKNNFLASVEGPTDDINGSIVAAEKKFSITFSKANTKFCLLFLC